MSDNINRERQFLMTSFVIDSKKNGLQQTANGGINWDVQNSEFKKEEM